MTDGGPDRRAARNSSLALVALLVILSLGVGTVGGMASGNSPDAGASTHHSPAAVMVGGSAGPVAQTDNGSEAGSDGGSQLPICDRDASTFVGVFNERIDSVPSIVKDRTRDSNVHLQIFGNAGGNYTMVTDEQAQVVSYRDGKPESASVRVETDCETFRAITDSGDPGATLQTAYENDEIRFIGLTTVNRLFFTGVATLTDPISLAAVLFLLILLLVALYILYRRLSIYYRGGEPAIDPEE